MHALYRSGRQAEALQAFTTTRHHLSAELGLDPSGRLRAIHEQILRGSPEMHHVPAEPPCTVRTGR